MIKIAYVVEYFWAKILFSEFDLIISYRIDFYLSELAPIQGCKFIFNFH